MKSSFLVAMGDTPMLKENELISLECFSKICFTEENRSGSVYQSIKSSKLLSLYIVKC